VYGISPQIKKLAALWMLALMVSGFAGAKGNSEMDMTSLNDASLLNDVILLDGPFKQAFDGNVRVLLQYDADRLLAPFLKEAGLTPRGEPFPNWAGLAGHVAGHYLSALAFACAAGGNPDVKERLDYCVAELKRVQRKNGNGYIGGVPNGKKLWADIRGGNVAVIRNYWVPWYNVHKTYAGLRDAWIFGKNEDARQMFLDLCDWGLTVIAPLDGGQMEAMLDTEFGGMNEVYADAYRISGNKKYLDAAKRFSHRELFESMARQLDNLDNKHANTQVPKAVGYARVAELSGDSAYYTAARFFWETVVYRRSLSLGGNSRREHFPAAGDALDYVTEREGPETCNTYNMLKLTEILFRMEPRARYADFYERALFNHILSSRHPEHGGYVYFTSARPEHYRVYSAPNRGMWCCVGTGMENHGKYGEFIYAQQGDTLYVNLFAASELNWKAKNIRIAQNTRFPEEETSRLTIHTETPARFTLAVRFPGWTAAGAMEVIVDGRNYALDAAASAGPASYIMIDRQWSDGDEVYIRTPMEFRIEELPGAPNYISFLRGPVLLGAKTGTGNLTGLTAGDDRWAHIASGPLVPSYEAPVILGGRQDIAAKLRAMRPVEGKPLAWTNAALFTRERDKALVFEPFFGIHDSRYMMYWLSMPADEYREYEQRTLAAETERLALDRRTIDMVQPGEQQSEVDHRMRSRNASTGIHAGERWRDAAGGGYFQYNLAAGGAEEAALMVRYWGNESGARTFDILIDGQRLVTENITGKWNRNMFVDIEYPVPRKLLQGKDTVTVRFQCAGNNIAGGIFALRLLQKGP
jgi:DUF1680 family protein